MIRESTQEEFIMTSNSGIRVRCGYRALSIDEGERKGGGVPTWSVTHLLRQPCYLQSTACKHGRVRSIAFASILVAGLNNTAATS